MGFGDKKVTLQKRDGKLIKVPGSKLSEADQKFYREKCEQRPG